MKKEKVLFFSVNPPLISFLRDAIHNYTINNGSYPDFIDMPSDIFDNFQTLFIDGPSSTFMGIKLRRV